MNSPGAGGAGRRISTILTSFYIPMENCENKKTSPV